MSKHVRIATYNIHKCKGLDQRTRPERVAQVIRELDADVVALQEVVDSRFRPEFDQVSALSGALPEYECRFGDNRPLYGGGYGNLTLSRIPIRECRNYDLTWGTRERRGCLRTDVEIDGVTLHVFNVHLGTGFVERRHQAKLFLGPEILGGQDFGWPKVVVGDFNEWTRGLATRLMSSQFESVDAKLHVRFGRTYPGVLPFLHLDHFYFDKEIALRNYRLHKSRLALIASDHLPIVAEFALG